MNAKLQLPITALTGIGPTIAKRLERLEIRTMEDLLWHLPFRYDDLRETSQIVNARIGQTMTFEAEVELIANRQSSRKKMQLTEALLRDESGTIAAVWFHQPFLTKTIRVGDRMMFSGKVQAAYGTGTLQLVAPTYERAKGTTLHVGRLVPIYPTTANITQKQLRAVHFAALKYLDALEEYVPESILAQEKLLPLAEALRELHFPADEHQRDKALERLKFDELLLFQLRRQQEEQKIVRQKATPIPFDLERVKQFLATLPFTLTKGQKKAAWDILQDLEKPEPMNRLLEGEVGSGKTVVAALAAYQVMLHDFQVILMAPTEILARQHFASIAKMYASYDVPVYLWTHGFHEHAINGTVTHLTKNELAAALKEDKSCFVIGTHALLEEQAEFRNVGLVVIDEQQRFGVGQRDLLHTKGKTSARVPHFLSLTATPIPRTLALTLAGNLQLSILSELPHGRKPITSRVVLPEEREKLYVSVDKELAVGRQAFVLAPLIETSDKLGVASATALEQELRTLFPHRKLGLLHGRLSSEEKDHVLTAFAQQKLDLLVATAVVEVGIDVPNATVMVIEGAERFGLSQLHQLRGRVGRGEHQSYCYLLPSRMTPLVRKRLDAVVRAKNGFELAELDLQLRGPGDLVGIVQSGFLDFQFASLGDSALMQKTSVIARSLLEKDPQLHSVPALRQKLDMAQTGHKE